MRLCKILVLAIACSILQAASCFANSVISIDSDPTIGSEQEHIALNAVNKTTIYMLQKYGSTLDSDISVFLMDKETRGSGSGFSENDIANNVGGKSTVGSINLQITPTSSEYYITFLVAHELVHQYQMGSYGSTNMMNKNMWFIEGMADVLAVEIASPVNPSMASKFKEQAMASMYNCPYTLDEITDKIGWRKAFKTNEKVYAKADLAVLWLYNNYPHDRLFEYMRNLYTFDANSALKVVYGISIRELNDKIANNEQSSNLETDLSMYGYLNN